MDLSKEELQLIYLGLHTITTSYVIRGDLEGTFFYDKAREDLPFYGDRATEIDKLSKTASDFWIEFDRPIYKEDNKFSDLLNEIQKIKKL